MKPELAVDYINSISVKFPLLDIAKLGFPRRTIDCDRLTYEEAGVQGASEQGEEVNFFNLGNNSDRAHLFNVQQSAIAISVYM